jgi:hypothetical protein
MAARVVMPIGRFTIWVGASLLALNFRILGLILSNGGLGPRKTALQFSGLVHIHPQFFTSNGDVDNAALDQALACCGRLVPSQIFAAIQSLGHWWNHLETIWIVQCVHTPGEIRDRLKSRIGNEDQLLVIDISGDAAGWVGVNESGRTWLEANI